MANNEKFMFQPASRWLRNTARRLSGRWESVLPSRPSWDRRVPVQLQFNPTECGAACLAMILSYHGRATGIAECRARLGPGRDGVKVQTIVQAARDYGLRTRVYSAELHQFMHISLPAIVHWNFNHFVIVSRWWSTKVEIIDPAFGRRVIGHDEFGKSFTGIVITFEPGAHFVEQGRARFTWRGYLRYVLRAPGVVNMIVQVLGASLLLQMLGLGLPLFTKVLVDQVLPAHTLSLLGIIGLGMVVIVGAQLIAGYLRATLLLYLQWRFDIQIMLGIFEHILKLPFSFFEQRTSGDLLTRLGNSAVIRELLTSQTFSVVLDGALMSAYLLFLLFQAPLFGVLALILAACQIGLLLLLSRRMHEVNQHYLVAQSESQGFAVQALKGIATLKSSGIENLALDYWSNLFFKELQVLLKRNHLMAIMNAMLAALRMLSSFLLLWAGAFFVINGSMSLGTMLALSAIAVAFLTPLASLVATGQQLQLVRAHLSRIADVIEAEPEQIDDRVRSAPRLTGHIELRNVNFRYDPNAPFVLHNVSLTVAPGQKVAIVGRTGSGKSTLAHLLLGLYAPTEGEILYDGHSLAELNYRSVRCQIGVVLQEGFLFSGSVRQNISLNNPELPFERLVEAARLAAIHDDIMQMPMQYETTLGEGGIGLSGGQRQRLALARALANQPALLLLDEATSHLDVETEMVVEHNLNQCACTRIVIAHRLSTVCNADLILFVDEGRIAEQGSHDQLLALNGRYAAFVRSQFAHKMYQQVTAQESLVQTEGSPA